MRSRLQPSSSTSSAELDSKRIKRDLREFIEESRKGHRSTKELVSREITNIREQISSISSETNEAIGRVQTHLATLILNPEIRVSQEKRKHLLDSLKYPGFNERRNQVSDAYENTGRWIFAGDGEGDIQDDATSDSEDMGPEANESSQTSKINQDGRSELEWDSFSNWLRSTDTFYWISGKPGSGKSTLVKFIMDHPKTKKLLEVWKPETVIVSHFFWRPGNAMQQNIKGLLCSLLHQLLHKNTAALELALSSVPNSNMKDAETDWSTKELTDLCLHVSSAYNWPVCIFLDGLDEVDPRDGALSLLNLIDKISQGNHIKLCLSSRPEPLLQRRLSSCPRLRLHHLNRSDLNLYARHHVRFHANYIAEHDEDPIRLLVDMSEGVFLWLVLAIKSVNKGMNCGDNINTLEKRIHQLPRDLISLYQDMWKRASEDDPLEYRQTAALYFRLLLTHQENGAYFLRYFDNFAVLPFMLASTSTADHILQARDQTPQRIPKEVMLQKCKEVERKVDDYCFGLVEISPESLHGCRPKLAGIYGLYYDELIPFADSRRTLRFIHRTAHDFLVDTEEGRAILYFNAASKMALETRLIKAYLAESSLFLLDYNYRDLGPNLAEIDLLFIRSLRLRYRNTDNWVTGDWTQLLHYFEVLCKDGKIFSGFDHRETRLCKSEDFLKVLANSCGDERILSAIRHGILSEDAKSEILLNACNTHENTRSWLYPWDHFVEETIQTLLREGANPNYKGFMFSPASWRWPFAQIETPFMQYLENILMFIKYNRLRSDDLVTVLKTLCTFLYYGANLGEMVTLYFDLKPCWYVMSNNEYFDSGHCVPPEDKETVWMLDSDPLSELRYRSASLIEAESQDGVLFASFPARSILDVLLHRMRQDYPSPVQKAKFRRMLLFLQSQCLGSHGGEDSRVIGRVCLVENRDPGWFETTGENQKRIASELLDYLWDCRSLYTDYCWHIHLEEGHGGRVKLLCAQAPWVQKVSGSHALWARCEELGIFTRVDQLCEIHSTKDWVKRRKS